MTLRVGDPEEIQEMFISYNVAVEKTIDEIISLCYFMRGAISYDEMLLRTPGERQRIDKFVSRRFEIESKKMYPIY